MHLKQIKLSGFKSFVDTTSIPFANEMTAIVGPNGCGKSNIIDAVRWVLGESSAKNLRGDSMTDVIFNGATTRKPVGQASVELIFDNTHSRVQGSMADRNEISIRRTVNRDSQNSYYLNGGKCRRKDITDIFLGTGLGPRSYAIIEQGMISKLIESKPQELRVFIEEAAGVSKYKERRRETETRIKHTRDNLVRLSDIKKELREQLDKLSAQSEAANKFRTLKKQERQLKSQLIAFRWQQCQVKIEKLRSKQLVLQTEIAKIASEQTACQLSLINVRAQQDEHNDTLALLQKKQLKLTRDITRLEQNIQHSKQSYRNLEQSITDINQNKDGLVTHIEQQSTLALNLFTKINELEPTIGNVTKQVTELRSALHDIQHRQRGWQSQWDEHQQSIAVHTNKKQLNDSQLSASHLVIDNNHKRLDELTVQIQQLNTAQQSSKLQALVLKHKGDIKRLNDNSQALVETKQTFSDNEQALFKANAKKRQLDNINQTEQAELSALESLITQQSSAQRDQQTYLDSIGVNSSSTLLQTLTVETKWQLALQMVIGGWLNANLVEQWPESFPLTCGQLFIHNDENNIKVVPGTLAECVSNNHPFTEILNTILVVSNETLAKQKSEHLAEGQSVICPQGVWYAKSWFRKGLDGDTLNSLASKTRVAQLKQSIAKRNKDLMTIHNSITDITKHKSELEQSIQGQQYRLDELNHQHRIDEQDIKLLKQEIQIKQQQFNHYQAEFSELNHALSNDVNKQEALLAVQKGLLKSPEINNDVTECLNQQRVDMNRQQDKLQQQILQINQKLHATTIEYEQLKVQRQSIVDNLQRENTQLNDLNERLHSLQKNMSTSDSPIDNEEQQLTSLLRESVLLDNSVKEQHQLIAQANDKILSVDDSIKKLMNRTTKKKDELSKKQLEIETLQIKSQALIDQLNDTQKTLENVLTELPTTINESQWHINIERINKQINQLGAINLAAISEFETQQQRFDYLENQSNDLEIALTTLETAIKKIDNESRDKFKNTFDKVNSDLKALFPKVFGGGSAYLDLTGEDFLDTGVTIMARPPGKKNSTIHLLSGGEKALTALSLVFAIFRLNPAPFCMLDEVDAPLDDANVGRFCNLVKEMSQTVQFIYISHNKIAMEMASHLTGVTMFEPGVSRMVAVDIDDAIAMAEEY